MSDGDARDRSHASQRASQRLASSAPRGDDTRPTRRGDGAAREQGAAAAAPLRRASPGTVGAVGASRPTGALRPVAPTRPLAPPSPDARRGAYRTLRNADDASASPRGAPLTDLAEQPPPYGRPARPRAGWRRFTPILLGLVAGIALVAVALGALILFAPRAAAPPAPSVATQSLCADLTAQRYADAYALLSPRLQAQGSQAQFIASQRELDALDGNVTTCNAAILNVAGSSASAALQVTRAHAKPASAAVTLTAIGSAWRVDSYDTAVI